ncbi:MAG TPA: response regulator transcription factor [Longimicrobiales bacterium]|nr:response regulator transcription factor [Longimicrobiales bacterium]
MPPEIIRILLVDDHLVLRAGLKALLDAETDMRVVGEASTGEEAIEKAKTLRPDVIVMDLSMPGMGGLEATRLIAEGGAARVLVLTMHSEEEYLLPVLEAGGSGYVKKTSADEDLTNAIRTVARDEVFLYPNAAKLLLQGFRVRGEDDQPDPLEKLTERERDVLAMTAEGYSSSEIGEKLFISPKTVDTYRSRIMEKLGLHHRSELVRFALNTGLLKAD